MTIRDVARLAGVDQSLVSRVVNDDPNVSLRDATRQKILDAVEQLGYRANVVARGLRMARTWTLGFLLPDFSNPLYSSIVSGAESQAARLGYGVVLGTHVEGAQDDTFTKLLQQKRVDGLLAASGMLRDSFMRTMAADGPGPVVLVNRRVSGIRASVVVDDEAGARLAVRHLADLGHSQVAGLFGPSFIDTAQRRRLGFGAACEEAGMTGSVVEMGAWDPMAGYQAAVQALTERPQTTALFASTFLMGVGALAAARDLKVSVPKRLSIVALHDSDLADFLSPALTTIAMPTEEMGRQGVELLAGMIAGGRARHIVVRGEPRLVLRKSTAAPARR